MNRNTGAQIDDLDHLKQSIEDILTTPIGTRVMRGAYGSRLFELIDSPLNRSSIIDIYSAVAESLALWEDRLELHQVRITSSKIGEVVLSLTGKYKLDNKVIKIDGIVVRK